jgi:hypothetical protein
MLLRNFLFGASLLLGVGTAATIRQRADALGNDDVETQYTVQTPPLDTPWTHGLGYDPWPQHPHPQLQRSAWQSLNGIWKYRNASSTDEAPPFGQSLPREVMVPSCLESALSGIQGEYAIHSWFSHIFRLSDDWQSRSVLLHFGAIDYDATIYVSISLSCRVMILMLL